MSEYTGYQGKGSGLYGAPGPTHKTACPQSNNPNGHNWECACGWYRASQVTPYIDEVPDGDV